ncbi:MAG: hypothetical protein ACOZNI_31445 [Myxococcota bacterium]
MLLTLLACGSGSIEVGDAPLSVEESVTLRPFATGGFDNWDGEALAWAVDDAHSLTLVAAMRYPTGEAAIDLAPSDDAGATARAWESEVPVSLEDDTTRFGVLDVLLTDAPGVRALPGDLTVLLYTGSPQAVELASIWIAVEGEGTLTRNDGGTDDFEGTFVFVEASGLAPDAEVVDPTYGLEVADVGFSFPARGL